MKKLIYLCIVLVLTVFTVVLPKEIKSSEKGGDWHSKKTWVGGKIPTKDDDVEIIGKVTAKKLFKCKNITVNKSSSLVLKANKRGQYLIIENFTLFGCLDIEENVSLNIYGQIIKKSECLHNEGMLTVGH